MRIIERGVVLTVAVWLGLSVAASGADGFTDRVLNPLGRPVDGELVRLRGRLPDGVGADQVRVLVEGRPVPFQWQATPTGAQVWVAVTLPAAVKGQPFPAMDYQVGERPRGEAAVLPEGGPRVKITTERDSLTLDNGLIAVRIPARAAPGASAPAPVQAVRLADGRWVGAGGWEAAPLAGFEASVTADGRLFGEVQLSYRFSPQGGTAGFARVTLTLAPGQSHVAIAETHTGPRNQTWHFDLAAGWGAREAHCRVFGGGASWAPDPAKWPRTLASGPETPEAYRQRYQERETRIGRQLIRLVPRWNQHYECGWFFAAADQDQALGALVCRAGAWVWPHDNELRVLGRPEGDVAVVRAPAWRGARHWFLFAAPRAAVVAPATGGDPLEAYVRRHAFEPLAKLHADYLLDWPGQEEPFQGEFFFSGNINPTGFWRQQGKRDMQNAGKPGGYSDFIKAQIMLDPDMYGNYGNYWSPQNPNFYTDFIKRPLALLSRCKAHPRFPELARRAEAALRDDLTHSVTLPGGAGQECPGYQNHAAQAWRDLAGLCRAHLGFDPATWPRFRAVEGFLLHASAPNGVGARLCHPGGDTHPPGPAIKGGVGGFVSEELPGFGVILRHRPGTKRETYVAFKSGPNRGHYHGDQLSLHLAFKARLSAVDHHCSYRPRAGQEHMHNRVAFHRPDMPYANLDGYERVLALKTGALADIAVGQVENDRLRETREFPSEEWDQRLPEWRFAGALVYRRTLVLVKGGPEDYLVVRDQFEAPEAVGASLCWHILGATADREGGRVACEGLTLVCLAPANPAFRRHDWSHDNGGVEATKGVRFTQEGRRGEFITVLWPGQPPPVTIEQGVVKVGTDEIVFGGDLAASDGRLVEVRRAGAVAGLDAVDLDFTRSQGDIGLFVPDAGYPFGEIPDWLVRQRAQPGERTP